MTMSNHRSHSKDYAVIPGRLGTLNHLWVNHLTFATFQMYINYVSLLISTDFQKIELIFWVHDQDKHTHTYTHVHTLTHTCAYTCKYTHVHTNTCTCMRTHTYTKQEKILHPQDGLAFIVPLLCSPLPIYCDLINREACCRQAASQPNLFLEE